ncbi:MAG: hypothetical protein V1862_06200 [Methanobacteriota archaeon]
MREVFIFEAGTSAISDEKREDIREGMNYQKALSYAKEEMETQPLSWKIILHLLLQPFLL